MKIISIDDWVIASGSYQTCDHQAVGFLAVKPRHFAMDFSAFNIGRIDRRGQLFLGSTAKIILFLLDHESLPS